MHVLAHYLSACMMPGSNLLQHLAPPRSSPLACDCDVPVPCAPLDLLRKFLIFGLCPFFYGAATRLPFIYYVIHLDSHFGDQITERFGSKWFPIGCFVAAYQVIRGSIVSK